MSSDPFEALRVRSTPRRPRPQFAVDLRRRIEEELGMTVTSTLAAGAYGVASGELGIIHIKVADADRAIAFYGALLGWQSERFAEDFVAHYVVNTSMLHVLTADPSAPDVRLFFPTGDVAAAAAEVERLGGQVTKSEFEEDGGGYALGLDDQGVELGIWKRNNRYPTPPDLSTPTGEVGYLTLSLPDTERGRAFYAGLLGWEYRPAEPGSDYHHVSNTSFPLGLVGSGSPEKRSADLFLRVAELEPAMATVAELGGETDQQYDSPSGRGCRMRDDQGTTLWLWEPAAGY